MTPLHMELLRVIHGELYVFNKHHILSLVALKSMGLITMNDEDIQITNNGIKRLSENGK